MDRLADTKRKLLRIFPDALKVRPHLADDLLRPRTDHRLFAVLHTVVRPVRRPHNPDRVVDCDDLLVLQGETLRARLPDPDLHTVLDHRGNLLGLTFSGGVQHHPFVEHQAHNHRVGFTTDSSDQCIDQMVLFTLVLQATDVELCCVEDEEKMWKDLRTV